MMHKFYSVIIYIVNKSVMPSVLKSVQILKVLSCGVWLDLMPLIWCETGSIVLERNTNQNGPWMKKMPLIILEEDGI